MFTIKNKAKSPKTVWDAENKKPLLTFKNGVFETEDEAIAEKAKALGYEVTGEAKKSGKGKKKDSTGTPETPEGTPETPEGTPETPDDSGNSAE